MRKEGKKMAKKKKKPCRRTSSEIYDSIRREWPDGFNPITRIIPDKRNRKPKHKEKGYEE